MGQTEGVKVRARRWALLLAAVVLLAVWDVPQGMWAQAPENELTCIDAATLQFDPGLRAVPRMQKITGQLLVGTKYLPGQPCTSATGVPYQGATGVIEGTGNLGCVSAAVMKASGTVDVTWDNGDKSLATWSIVSYGALPIVEARFVEGSLKGGTIYQEGTPTGIRGSCTDASPLTGGGFSGPIHVLGGER